LRYFIEISYNGKNYHGWQIQPNAISVQEILQDVFSKLLRNKILIMAAGRTDTGVHAKQLFAHIDFTTIEEKIITQANFLYKINAFLPPAIVIKKIIKVQEDAHARFNAISRSYEYQITLKKNPFLIETSWQIQKPLAIHKMNQAAAILLEYTNFKCFSRSKTDVKTYNCTITEAFWKQEGDLLIFYISANRFLRNMVRAIVGTLVAIGQHKIDVQHIRYIIDSQNRNLAGVSAPAKGLFLTKVDYSKTIFSDDKGNR